MVSSSLFFASNGMLRRVARSHLLQAAVFFTYLTSANPHSQDAFTKIYTIEEMKAALFQTLATIERLQHALPSTEAFDPSSLNVAM